ncbi:MAG: hypothetical protein RMJ51_06350 [Candidatus Calescibacterium sp.]|nr:hypothetical protein [Candidatus Calescibacterium sp.]MCX7971631.1 hypothetical protein [bacterium]MDW8195839.1 hypothetical protein [Candidatus Calescibacterium sp.]
MISKIIYRIDRTNINNTNSNIYPPTNVYEDKYIPNQEKLDIYLKKDLIYKTDREVGVEVETKKEEGENRETRVRVGASIGYSVPEIYGTGVRRINPHTIEANVGASISPLSAYAEAKLDLEAVGKSEKAEIYGGLSLAASKNLSFTPSFSIPYNSNTRLDINEGSLSFRTSISTDALKLPIPLPEGKLYIAGNVNIYDTLIKAKQRFQKTRDLQSIKNEIRQEIKELIKPAATKFAETLVIKARDFSKFLQENGKVSITNINESIIPEKRTKHETLEDQLQNQARKNIEKMAIKVISISTGNIVSRLLGAIAPSVDMAVDNINENDLLN